MADVVQNLTRNTRMLHENYSGKGEAFLVSLHCDFIYSLQSVKTSYHVTFYLKTAHPIEERHVMHASILASLLSSHSWRASAPPCRRGGREKRPSLLFEFQGNQFTKQRVHPCSGEMAFKAV